MSTLDIEYRDIVMECSAIDSAYYMMTIFTDFEDIGYNGALEAVDTRTLNIGERIINALKKIFLFLPKLFVSLFKRIKHSKVLTKIRSNASIPEDLKKINDNKLSVIKTRRIEILTLKQQCMDIGDKKIQTALRLSDELCLEVGAIANVISQGKSGTKDVIKGKYEIAETKIKKIITNMDSLKTMNIHDKVEALKNKLNALKEECDDDRLFALAVPQYKGTDKSELYAGQIKRNCEKYTEVANKLKTTMIRDTDIKTQAMKLASNIGHDKDNEYEEKHPEQYSVKNVIRQERDMGELKKSSSQANSSALQLSKLYLEGSNACQKIAKEYSDMCRLVYHVYEVPGGEQHTEIQSTEEKEKEKAEKEKKEKEQNSSNDNNEKNEKNEVTDDTKKKNKQPKIVKTPKGEFEYDDSKGCWVYTGEITDKSGQKHTISMSLKDQTDPNAKPALTEANEKEMQNKLKEKSKLGIKDSAHNPSSSSPDDDNDKNDEKDDSLDYKSYHGKLIFSKEKGCWMYVGIDREDKSNTHHVLLEDATDRDKQPKISESDKKKLNKKIKDGRKRRNN